MVEGPGCALNGEKIRARVARGQVVRGVRGTALQARFGSAGASFSHTVSSCCCRFRDNRMLRDSSNKTGVTAAQGKGEGGAVWCRGLQLGEHTTSLGNWLHCSIALTLRRFFLTFSRNLASCGLSP
uniref:Uncharacterized protein n=1 Tax=Varanus komodoensis TaxID=61221 RepID=A0A8D2LQB9_VARKO